MSGAGRPLPGVQEAADQRIAALLRQVPVPKPLPQARHERVLQRLRASSALTRHGRAGRLRWPVVVALLGSMAGVGFAHRRIGPWIERAWQTLQGESGAAARRNPGSVPARVPGSATGPALSPAAAIAPAAGAQDPAGQRAPAGPDPKARPRRELARPHHPRSPGRLSLGLASAPAPVAAAQALAPAAVPPPADPSPAAPRILLPEPDRSTSLRQALADTGAPQATSSASAGGKLGSETELLREALQSLRHDDDPAGALATLDLYDQRFPRGLLAANAQLVRLDALLAQGQRAEASKLLARLDLVNSPRADELRILRAELLAPRGCRSAVAGFTAALARDLDPKLAERALQGRARCWLELGDQAAARADLTAYLQRFPSGPFAAQARQRLSVRH